MEMFLKQGFGYLLTICLTVAAGLVEAVVVVLLISSLDSILV